MIKMKCKEKLTRNLEEIMLGRRGERLRRTDDDDGEVRSGGPSYGLNTLL